jgi:hypothetical protein
MSLGIFHGTIPTGTDSGNGKVSFNAWSQAHAIQCDPLSVVGNPLASGTAGAEITASGNGQVLQMAAGVLSFAALTAGMIPSLGGNPSASVGLSATNGVATTYMRSDAAPALSQSISPTWTGNHTFSPASGVGAIINGTAGNYCAELISSATGYGLLIEGGTTVGQTSFIITNSGTSVNWVRVFNDGGMVLANPTGGDKGLGTLNATGLYVNGVAVAVGASSAMTTIVQTGGASQNYTIPASNMHLIIAIGGGGGGQAGGAAAAGNARSGGGGGGGGGIMWALVPTAAIIGVVTLTVSFSNAATGGAGGVGGTATTGASGTSGSSVSVLGVLAAYGGTAGAANNGGSGGAGMWVPGTSGGTGGNGAQGAAGQDSNPANFTGTAVNFSCLGGGGGGGVSAGNASFNGGRGGEGNANANPGSLFTQNGVGAGGTTAGGNAIQPFSPLGATIGGAGGGGGGGASTAGGTGGNGAAGSDYGGGGGGGGATTTGSGSPVSGNGGRGGYAAAIFVAW